MHTEAELLEAMAYATPQEQRRLSAELEAVRASKSAAIQADRDVDLGASYAHDLLTPVLVHGQHTASTDWLDDVAPNYHTADLKNIDREIRAEAANWFRKVHPAVREDQGEFGEQARGVARRTASQYGTLQNQVANLFMTHVASLYRLAEGTDMAGVPSAAGDSSNPDLDSWTTETKLPEANAPALDAPEGIDAAPDAPSPEGGSGESTPTDSGASGSSAVDAADLLDVTDANNAAGSTQSEVSMASRRTAFSGDPDAPDDKWDGSDDNKDEEEYEIQHRFDDNGGDDDDSSKTSYLDKPSVWSQAANHFLAVEEGQSFPVPGEVDPEQDGEAKSTLPYSVEVSKATESFPSFVDHKPAAPADSSRAKNISANGAFIDLWASNPFTADLQRDKGADGAPSTKKDPGFEDYEGGQNTDNPKKKSAEDWQFHGSSSDEDPIMYSLDYNRGSGHPGGTSDGGSPVDDEDPIMYSIDHQGSHTAIATGPNPYGSMPYDPARVTDLGYKEGYRYAILWSPGKPVPAALSSSAGLGDKYNAEYVDGYKEGVAAGIATLSKDFKAAWVMACANPVQIAASRRTAEEGKLTDEDKEGLHQMVQRMKDMDDKSKDPNRKPGWAASKLAADQLELSAMDDTVSNPLTLSESGSGVDGKGAADVANVPTPGQKPGDYPQPNGASVDPAIGDKPVDPWFSEADSAKAAAFRAVVARNLARV